MNLKLHINNRKYNPILKLKNLNIICAILISIHFNCTKPTKKKTEYSLFANYDSIIICCTKCTFFDDTVSLVKQKDGSGNFHIQCDHPPVQFYIWLNQENLIMHYEKQRIKSNTNQVAFFKSLNSNRTLLNINMDTVSLDLRMLMLLKNKAQTDTFIYFNNYSFALNRGLYQTKTGLDTAIFRLFKNIKDYCY